MGLVTYIVGYQFLMYAVNGTSTSFIANVYGPFPVKNAMQEARNRNGGTLTGVGDWTWRVAPNLTDPDQEAAASPLQALEDSAVIQFQSLGKKRLLSMNCELVNGSSHGNIVSMTYQCSHIKAR